MTRRMLVAAAALVTHASPALADDEVVELHYSAPPECPDRDAVLAQIRERTPAVRFEDHAPRTFEIVITVHDGGFTGTLTVEAGADKQLTAARCDDLVSALALVTALAIDPTAAVTVPSRPPPPPPPAPPPPAPPPPPRREPLVQSLDATLGVALDGGLTPDPLLAASLAVRAEWRRTSADLAVLIGRDSTTVNDSVARFTWAAARPAGCYRTFRTAAGRRLELDGCGHAEFGLVRASGEQIINGRALTRLWAAVGAHAGVRWPVSSRSFGQLQLGASFPLTRDRYRFAPDMVIHETAIVTGWLLVGIGVRFP